MLRWESELVAITKKYYQDREYLIIDEIPICQNCCDLVAKKDGQITAIEVKLRDWKRVLNQVRCHGQAADYVTISIAFKNIPKAFKDECIENGYGILHYNWESKTLDNILEPRRQDPWQPIREILNNRIDIFSKEIETGEQDEKTNKADAIKQPNSQL